jgi:hypothetical protein
MMSRNRMREYGDEEDGAKVLNGSRS